MTVLLLTSYLNMKPLHYKKVKFLPLGNGATAITTPWGVCYYKGQMPDWLKRHEEVHWKQMHELGKVRFLIEYFWENITKGYKDNKFEVEARKAERGRK